MAELDLVVSATEVALNVIAAGVGTVGGAVYVIGAPDALLAAETVPQVGPLHPAPESDQVTPLFAGSFCTVAVKLCVPDTATLAEVEESETETGALGADNVIAVEADFVGSATDVAVTVTAAGEGTVVGAVYVTGVPDALEVGDTLPHAAPLHPAPDTVHVTPLAAESFVTVAVRVCVWPACTVIDAGATLTAIAAGGGSGAPPPDDPPCEAAPVQPVAITAAANNGRARMWTPVTIRFTASVLPKFRWNVLPLNE